MKSSEIRRNFLHYFKHRGHTIIASSPVVPHDDPTLLFTNAGMNQFKDTFLGKEVRDYTRAATSQKCVRVGGKHNDLDNVGHTSRHLTFFEMLGNFSFGDYFKKEAITFAWEVATQIFKFSEDKIWPTIFQDDEEAFEIWKKIVPEKRITRFGEKENFWTMGDVGPCGPCSELLFDRGPKYGSGICPKEDPSGERYLEFWNLVFMQFNRVSTGELSPLPKPSIDTGVGLERVVALHLCVDSVFATDILRSLIAEVENVSGRSYHHDDHASAPAYHVIADHIRSLAFAIADGAQPSNVDRGYVLRKLLRRAVRYGRSLGMQDPFLAKIIPRLTSEMGEDYPELKNASSRIAEILTIEEENFLRTLRKGGNILNNVIDRAKKGTFHQISGEDAFKLKDTYGFPFEEILLIAKDAALEVNLEQYQLFEELAREKSRSAQTAHSQVAEESLFKEFLENEGMTRFTGYSTTKSSGKIVGIVKDGHFVDTLSQGEKAWIFLDATPFYAEKGGQVGDIGVIRNEHCIFRVCDCQSPFSGLVAHVGQLDKGTLLLEETVFVEVDALRRETIMAHHTAAHLLHWALQEVLGPHIRQAGSLVEPNRMRFDFNHHKSLSKEEIRRVEELINAKVRTNAEVVSYELPYEEAQKKGEIKQFFGDKYGATVRVIDMDFSKELCGGTHVHHLGSIGLFRIVKEGSISAGVRRIEAVVGKAAEQYAHEREDLLLSCATLLKTTPQQVPESLVHLQDKLKRLDQEIKGHRRQLLQETADKLFADVVIAEVDFSGDDLHLLADELLQKNSLAVVLGAKTEGRAQLLIRLSSEMTNKGLSAVHIIKEIAPLIEGSGGGKEASAQAGGKDSSGLSLALAKAKKLLTQ